MNESEFWSRLEWRVGHELTGLHVPELRNWWCDGFGVEHFEPDRGRFSGVVYMLQCESRQKQTLEYEWRNRRKRGKVKGDDWRFLLLTGDKPLERELINWAALLPGYDMTGWLGVDVGRRKMT